MVGYFEAFVFMFKGCKKELNALEFSANFYYDFYKDLVQKSVVTIDELTFVTFMALGFTLLRYLVTNIILQPLANYFNFQPKDKIKFPESCWKLAFYSLAFGIEAYLLLWRYPELLTDPRAQWIGWEVGMAVPNDIYFIYVLEAGFYFHSVFTTIFMDMWRKDLMVMVAHHCLAMSLIIFSLAIRYHRLGLVVLFLHDLADVFLEFTKICTCFKGRTTNPSKAVECFIAGGFLSFAVTWFVMRLYIYPLVVLYSAGYVARLVLPNGAFYFFFNMQLWILFFMNIWWFHFIVQLIIRILTGKSKEVEDTRELSEEQKREETRTKKENVYQNGCIPQPVHHQNSTTVISHDGIVQNGKSEARRRQPAGGDIH